MTFRVAQTVGLVSIFAVGLFTILASNGPQTADKPMAIEVKIPSFFPAAVWEDVPPAPDGSFTVIPFVTQEPMVRVNFQTRSSSIHVTAQDDSAGGPVVQIPQVPTGPGMPTGYVLDNIDTNPTPPRWQITIKLPASFQTSSGFTINISAVSNGNESQPVKLGFMKRIYLVSVSLSGGGHITSNPNGISCAPPTVATDCDHTFDPPPTGVVLTVYLNAGSFQTNNFSGWGDGACSTANSSSGQTGSTCTLTLDGTRKLMASASFNGPPPGGQRSCPTVFYPHFVEMVGDAPKCPSSSGTVVADCDSQAFWRCPTGAPFCDKPDEILKQPGGCYKIDAADPPP